MVAIMLDGFLTGLVLQIAIGPVFFFIFNLSLQKSIVDGLVAVIAVTLVDYIFIALAVLGVGKLLERPGIKFGLGIISSLVLVFFGIMIMTSITQGGQVGSLGDPTGPDYTSSFVSAFLLTGSSPLTIVFWTGLFAAKAIERGYARRQLVFFGLAAGMATFFFLGSSVTLLSILRASIPLTLLRILNTGVGGLLIFYGAIRLSGIVKPSIRKKFQRRSRVV
jgi:threonine/homoserine/homoserine lactone efflux protein